MNNQEQIKPIKVEPKKQVKLNIKEPTKIINKLPSWSLEPPLEINRSKK